MTRPAFVLRPHQVGRGAGHDEGAGQVDVDDLAPMVEIDIVPGDEGHDRGVVDENVDTAGLSSISSNIVATELRVGNVAVTANAPSADRRGDCLCAVAVDVGDDDASRRRRQPRGDRLADALCRARDDRRLPCEPIRSLQCSCDP